MWGGGGVKISSPFYLDRPHTVCETTQVNIVSIVCQWAAKSNLIGKVTGILLNGNSCTLIDIGLNVQFCYVRCGLHKTNQSQPSLRTLTDSSLGPTSVSCATIFVKSSL